MKHVYMIGIGGIGMSGLARLCLENGIAVSGSDLRMSDTVRELTAKGVTFFEGHAYEHISDAIDCVVYTSAAGADNPERRAAVDKGIRMMTRAEFLMQCIADKEIIAVAGSHGKTTTTSLTAEVLRAYEGEDASFYIGGILQSAKTNAHRGKGRFMAVELDESDASFLLCTRGTAIVTTIDYEHVDFYPTEKEYIDAFVSFINNFDGEMYIGREAYEAVRTALTRSVRVVGLDSDRCPDSYDHNSFTIDDQTVHLTLTGVHAVFDAWCAYCALRDKGICHETIAQGLSHCAGAERRMQEIYNDGAVVLVDDYGHHPSEIAVTYTACEKKYEGKKKIVLFQPHRYSRFSMFYREFYAIMRDIGDVVVILPVYGAAEAITGTHTAEEMAVSLREERDAVLYAPTHEDAVKIIMAHLSTNSAVLFFGAGDGNKVLCALQQRLKERK